MSPSPLRLRRRLGHSGIALLVLATSSSLLWTASSGTASAAPDTPRPVCTGDGTCTLSFPFTGTVQTWTVPNNVTSLSAAVSGAAGGSSIDPSDAGLGGRSTGTFAVSAGEKLSLVVGGAGAAATSVPSGATGGFGGGGDGGDNRSEDAGGSSGGGGSFLFEGDTLLLAAGGGGGASGDSAGGAGGAAGTAASAGTAGNAGAAGGDPGTDQGNGLGGGLSGGAGSGEVTATDSLPLGGRGGNAAGSDPSVQQSAGAGGGGGYHAGGGGAAPDDTTGSVSGGGGGGGAGFASAAVTATGQAGARAGDGQVTLTYADFQHISFTSDGDGAVVGRSRPYSVSAEGTGSDPIVFSIDPATTNGACTIQGTYVTFAHVGTCAIAADQAADSRHTAGHAVQSFAVAKGNQTITFVPLPTEGTIGDIVPLEATGSTTSGIPVVFSLGAATTKGACTVDGTNLRLTGAGRCAVLADQAGDDDYKAALSLVQEVLVNRVAAATSLTFGPSTPVYGQPVTATATVTGAVDGTVSFSVDGDPVGGTVALGRGGTASVTLPAGLGAGGHPVKATFTPTDSTTYVGSSDEQTLPVAKAQTQTRLAVRSDGASVTVTTQDPGAGTPQGKVVVTVGDTSSDPVELVDGKATFPGPFAAGQVVSVVYRGGDNFAGSSDSTLRRDPVISASVSSDTAESPTGWHRTPVTVSFTCTEGSAALSGECPDPVTLTEDGASQGVTRTITAEDGGVASVSVTGINIDTTGPNVDATGVAEGQRFFAAAPEAGCIVTDALSGAYGCSATREVTGKVVTYSVNASDQAGNVSTLEVHATTYQRGIIDAPYADGVYTVTAGHTYTL
ncbi:MAG: hypothetical protein ACRYG2_24570, partial [Janthinobacterium lividum]